MSDALKGLSPAKGVQPNGSVRAVRDPVLTAKETSGSGDPVLKAIGAHRPATSEPKDPHPSVSVKVTRLPSGQTVTTFVNPNLSKTAEALYVMWLNHQVTIQGNVVDLYS
ncbi:MAG: hypothetical protein EPO39_08410 [Candidatus Manganitrophaceae bacterium]|nr:MAG: hypothetical protein EPO39_08410 [Candidatus Manganitrophaceae bacterium]